MSVGVAVMRLRIVDQTTGAIAQLGERLLCTQEVAGSIPVGSTSTRDFRLKHLNEGMVLRSTQVH